MAKKGESYAQVGVDLEMWAKDYMRINNLNQAELAGRLFENGKSVHRARVCDMIHGRQNTMKFLGIIIDSIYAGDYTAMGRYAIDKDGEDVLRYMAFKKTLDELQKRTSVKVHSVFQKAIKKKNYKKIEEALKILES